MFATTEHLLDYAEYNHLRYYFWTREKGSKNIIFTHI